MPGRPSNLADSRARAYCACSGCGWGRLDIFTLIYLFSPLSPSLWETARYRLKYCLKGPLNPKQSTNQPTKMREAFANIGVFQILKLEILMTGWPRTLENRDYGEKNPCRDISGNLKFC